MNVGEEERWFCERIDDLTEAEKDEYKRWADSVRAASDAVRSESHSLASWIDNEEQGQGHGSGLR